MGSIRSKWSRPTPPSLLTSRSSLWRLDETSPGGTSPPQPCETEGQRWGRRVEEDEKKDKPLHTKGH